MKCAKCWLEFNAEKSTYNLCQICYDNFVEAPMHDYQLLVNKDTPNDIRRIMDIGDVRSNSIKCNKCWDIVRSKNRHNMARCSCENCAADWWSWYCKRLWNDYTELSEPFTFVDDKWL